MAEHLVVSDFFVQCIVMLNLVNPVQFSVHLVVLLAYPKAVNVKTILYKHMSV